MNKQIYFTLTLCLAFTATQAQNITVQLGNNEISHTILDSMINPPKQNDKPVLFSTMGLNQFFTTKISTYLSRASDLSLRKAYAVLDNEDGRLFIGANKIFPSPLSRSKRMQLHSLTQKQAKTKRAKNIWTAGVKTNVSNGYAEIFKGNKFSNDIGFSLKWNFLGRGSVNYAKDLVEKYYSKKVFLANEVYKAFDDELTTFKQTQTPVENFDADVQKFIDEKTKNLPEEYAKKEAAFFIEENTYTCAHSWWISWDAYIPITASTYNIAPDFTKNAFTQVKYRPFETTFLYTNFWEFKQCNFEQKGTVLLTVKGGALADNSVNNKDIDAYAFDEYIQLTAPTDTLHITKTASETVYVGAFKEYITPHATARLVYMPFSFIGISAAVEVRGKKGNNTTEIQALNWRLGIPISLKNDEGDASVNFELVWREVNKTHSIGLSIGLPLGEKIF